MKYNFIKSNTFVFVLLFLVGCSGEGNTSSDKNVMESQETLSLVANGEDFVRKGFTTKDGWEIDFERVEVTLGEVTAYQVPGGFNPEEKSQIKSETSIQLLPESKTINLAEGGESAEPIVVNKSKVPEGFYNALSWKMLPKTEPAFADSHTILLEGIAIKADRELNFLLGFNQPLKYICGEFIGDTRKGMVKLGENTELEMTFHFDHIFGDRTLVPEDELNQNALGFQPLADLTTSDRLKLSQQDLSQKLSSEAYQKLQKAISGIGHVGEGHCSVISVNS